MQKRKMGDDRMGHYLMGGLLCVLIGACVMAFGFRIWWKQKINLILFWPHSQVKPEDVEEYTQQMGKACALEGLGALTMGAFFLIYCVFGKDDLIYMGLVSFAIAFGFSAVMMYRAQRRYSQAAI